MGETMMLGLSCDHRLVDGAIAAKFLLSLSENLKPFLYVSISKRVFGFPQKSILYFSCERPPVTTLRVNPSRNPLYFLSFEGLGFRHLPIQKYKILFLVPFRSGVWQ